MAYRVRVGDLCQLSVYEVGINVKLLCTNSNFSRDLTKIKMYGVLATQGAFMCYLKAVCCIYVKLNTIQGTVGGRGL